jgi:hypothetical protein
MLQLLRDTAPSVSRVAVLWTRSLQMEEELFNAIQAAAPPLGSPSSMPELARQSRCQLRSPRLFERGPTGSWSPLRLSITPR